MQTILGLDIAAMRSRLALVVAISTAMLMAAGCASPVRFPAAPLVTETTEAGLVESYDTDGDGRPDYFTTEDATGRVVRIAYDTTGDGKPDEFVDLDAMPLSECRHVIFVLDGVGYDTIEAFWRAGRLRLFYPPRRIISTFPPMTDLALADVFGTVRPEAYEAVHYDRREGRLVGGNADYLNFKNEAWARRMVYRTNSLVDPLAYLWPDAIFNSELGHFLRVFGRRDRMELPSYIVSIAGIGTRQGAAGQRKVLELMDRLVHQLVWRTRGLVKVTMLSDHGHTLVRAERVGFRPFLAEKGWRIVERLERPRDVVAIEYGFVTYAAFATRDRAGLAADLVGHPAVDLVTYDGGEAVVVEKPGAKATIERRGRRYRYRATEGDPLELGPIVEKMKADGVLDADLFADDAEWFKRTVIHRYPDPLQRLWRAFHGVVEQPADVVASLKENYFAGAEWRLLWVPFVASTHGDLARASSTAFIMSTAGPLLEPDAAARTTDEPAIFEKLEGHAWPPAPAGGPR